MTATRRQHRMFDPAAPTLTGERFAWHQDAACTGMAQSLFYPAVGEDTREAKAVCEHCPVRGLCLADAMRLETSASPTYRHGILGGLSARERSKLARTGWRAGDPLPPVSIPRRGPRPAA